MIYTKEKIKTEISIMEDLIDSHPEMKDWANIGIRHLKGILRGMKNADSVIQMSTRKNVTA